MDEAKVAHHYPLYITFPEGRYLAIEKVDGNFVLTGAWNIDEVCEFFKTHDFVEKA